MFVLYNSSNQRVPIKIYRNSVDEIEDTCIEQAMNMANHPAVFKQVALMPDCHTGFGMPIGGVLALKNAVCPNAVGVDIGCGMAFAQTDLIADTVSKDILKSIIAQIKRDIPMGFSHNSEKVTGENMEIAERLVSKYFDSDNCNAVDIEIVNEVASQLSTLGGGNHFIELQVDNDGFLCVMLHSGSRNIGYQIAKKHDKIARELNKKYHSNIDKKADLAFLPTDSVEGSSYIKDMNFALEFAKTNRETIMEKVKYSIQKYIKNFDNVKIFYDVHHNYAAEEKHFGEKVWIHRKGATSAKKNEIGIIPGSMGTSSYIVCGKGNENSFKSCSHGAGRIMSRMKAKNTFSLNEFEAKMDGIISLDVDKKHLDESPMAYKDIDEVIKLQSELVEVINILKPIANIKG